ncbi:MAG: hypothetical protein ACRDSH_12475 [Pseudonocardiaceae bacterium]
MIADAGGLVSISDLPGRLYGLDVMAAMAAHRRNSCDDAYGITYRNICESATL